MAISTPEQPRDRRFQLRATAAEEALIKVATERRGVNVTEFILRSAREKAEQDLADRDLSSMTGNGRHSWRRWTGRHERSPGFDGCSQSPTSQSAGDEGFPTV